MDEEDKSAQAEGGISTKTAEIAVAVAFLIFGAVVAYDSYRLGAQWAADGPQSGYFPFYIGAMIVVASGVTLAQALLGGADSDGGLFVEWQKVRPVMAVLLPAAVYVLGVQLAGLYVASAVYIAAFMVWLGKYGWLKAVFVSAMVNGCLYLMFEVWFKVPLFKGSYDLLEKFGL